MNQTTGLQKGELRKVPAPVARRFRAAAGGGALTHAQYLTALVELHEMLRARGHSARAASGTRGRA